MLRTAGIILIFTGAVLLGYIMAAAPRKRYKNLLKIENGLKILGSEIEYGSGYIDDILVNVGESVGMEGIFKAAAKIKDKPIARRWSEAVNADKKKLFLSDEDTQLLLMLSPELGMTDKKSQVRAVEHIKKLIDGQIPDAKEEYLTKSRLFKSMGVAVGLFLIVILL